MKPLGHSACLGRALGSSRARTRSGRGGRRAGIIPRAAPENARRKEHGERRDERVSEEGYPHAARPDGPPARAVLERYIGQCAAGHERSHRRLHGAHALPLMQRGVVAAARGAPISPSVLSRLGPRRARTAAPVEANARHWRRPVRAMRARGDPEEQEGRA